MEALNNTIQYKYIYIARKIYSALHTVHRWITMSITKHGKQIIHRRKQSFIKFVSLCYSDVKTKRSNYWLKYFRQNILSTCVSDIYDFHFIWSKSIISFENERFQRAVDFRSRGNIYGSLTGSVTYWPEVRPFSWSRSWKM